MIRKEKLEIYLKYLKDVDYFAFSGSDEDKRIMADGAFYKIYELSLSIDFIQRGQAAKEYEEKLKRNLRPVIMKRQ